jgi:hypothetical protein
MREQTLVGLYPTRTVADDVRRRLEAEGVNQSDISLGADADEAVHHETAGTSKPASGFWAWLFGSDVSDEQRERMPGISAMAPSPSLCSHARTPSVTGRSR